MSIIEINKLEVETEQIRCSGRLLLSIVLSIKNQLEFAIGELSIYRQQNELDFDEFENIEVSLIHALNEVETIK